MNIEPGFVLEFGTSILAAIADIKRVEASLPEGISVGAINLSFEFNPDNVPEEFQGEWVVTIAKADAESVDDSAWSRPVDELLDDLATNIVACNKCDAIHDGGEFSECQVCDGQGPQCDDCELPVDICACDDGDDNG